MKKLLFFISHWLISTGCFATTPSVTITEKIKKNFEFEFHNTAISSITEKKIIAPASEHSVFITTTNPEVTLAGTLAYPKGPGPFTTVILVSGSGRHDRDGSVSGHKPFLAISDHLVEQGVAVLRYDDRGVGQSTGYYQDANSLDFASDVNAIFTFLTKIPHVKKNAIGVIGHSEGGLITPLAYSQNRDIAFLVLLAAPGVDSITLLAEQKKAMMHLSNVNKQTIQKTIKVSQKIMQTVRDAKNGKDAEKKVSLILTDNNIEQLGAHISQKSMLLTEFTSKWFRYFIRYDPAVYLPYIKVPILALGGSLDVQVPSKTNLAGIKKLTLNNNDVTVIELEGLNHLFQEAETGSVTEYRHIKHSIANKALNSISSWLTARY